MADTHPSRQALDRFLDGQLPPEKIREVVGHLLTDCPTCQQVTGDSWAQVLDGLRAARNDLPPHAPRRSSKQSGSPYGQLLARAIGRARLEAREVERSTSFAEQLYEELLRHPPKRRLTLVRNSRRFQTPELCRLLTEKGYERRFKEVQTGVELTDLAVAVGEQLTDETCGPEETQDLLGRAWAFHGNAQRVASDLRLADKAFQEARRCFVKGRGNDSDRALWCRFTALLLRARRDFEGAHSRQDQAIRLYLRQGEIRTAAQIMSDQALGILYEGKPEPAIARLEQALQLVIPLGDKREIATVRHNLAFCLAETGQHAKALEHTGGVRLAFQEIGDFLSLVRLRWLEGKILFALGHDRQAEEALVEACDGFIQEAIAYDAALVCLDLAAIYARQGRTAEIRSLVGQMVPIFQSRDVHREAIAALILFQEAALAETATLALVEKVSRYLRDARHDPKLRFESS